MAIITETDRKPNYYHDIKYYGKFAENDFLEMFHKKKLKQTIFDVRKKREYQEVDIDFIIDKNGEESFNESFQTILSSDRYQKIEVKYNSRALDTGWVAYESISHNSLGWGETTKCDLIYMVFTEKDSFKILKRAWLFMNKWKNFLANRKNRKKINYIVKEGVVDLLCNINDLEKEKVIKFI